MTAKEILQVFDQYRKARISFVQSVADLSSRGELIEYLKDAGALTLLKPFLSDSCVQIRQCAAVAYGRLAHHSAQQADEILSSGILPTLMRDIDQQNKYYKKAALFAVRSLCKHDTCKAKKVVEMGGLEALMICLEDFEPTVKQEAAWGLGYMARSSPELAQSVVDAGAIPLLITCLQEPELSLKQVSASALADVAKHTADLAQTVVDSGAVPHLAKLLINMDEKLKRQVLNALDAIARHSCELAEIVVEAEIFPSVLIHMAHACPAVRSNAAFLVRDIVKHSLELAQLVVNTGGVGALMEILKQPGNDCQVPVITSLGYIAGYSDQLALSVIKCGAVEELYSIIMSSKDNDVLAVTAWSLGQIGRHTPEHSRVVAQSNVFPRLLQLYLDNRSSEDLHLKCKFALKSCLQKCLQLSALEPLIYDAPPNILKYVLEQFTKVLPHDPRARRLFVTTGSLKKIQEIEAEPGSTLMEYIILINACFPEEIVRYYSPGYPEILLEQVEQYSPQLTFLQEGRTSEMRANINIGFDDATSTTISQDVSNVAGGI